MMTRPDAVDDVANPWRPTFLLDEAKASGKPGLRARAEAIERQLDALRVDLDKHAAKLRIEQLRRELVAARKTAKTMHPRVNRGQYPCPDCDRMFDTAQGRGAHRRYAHGYRKGQGPS